MVEMNLANLQLHMVGGTLRGEHKVSNDCEYPIRALETERTFLVVDVASRWHYGRADTAMLHVRDILSFVTHL